MNRWTVEFINDHAVEEFEALPADMRAKL